MWKSVKYINEKLQDVAKENANHLRCASTSFKIGDFVSVATHSLSKAIKDNIQIRYIKRCV